MSWGFRKSFSIGGLFRLNVSKSGVGASVGVKGARVSIDPRGRTALNVGAGGVYSRTALTGGGRRIRKARGNTSIGLAVGVVVVVLVAFTLMWPAKPGAAKAPEKPAASSVTKPALIPVVEPPKPAPSGKPDPNLDKVFKPGAPIAVPATVADKWVEPAAPKPTADEWQLKSGGNDGGAKFTEPADSTGARTTSGGRVWVEGYRKKDGTMVEGHWRER